MYHFRQLLKLFTVVVVVALSVGVLPQLRNRFLGNSSSPQETVSPNKVEVITSAVTVQRAIRNDVSRPLASQQIPIAGSASDLKVPAQALAMEPEDENREDGEQAQPAASVLTPPLPISAAGAAIEQKTQGQRPAAELVASFDGLGAGFEGPQGSANVRNPSDNTLAVGPDHIVQIVNTRMAVFTKKGKRFDTTGKVLYGPV